MKLLKRSLFGVLTVELVIVVVLGCLGFKITYDPNIVSDWNAVSATADWVSALATINITAYDAAAYLGTEKGRTVAMLDSLVERKLVVRTDSDGIGVYSLSR